MSVRAVPLALLAVLAATLAVPLAPARAGSGLVGASEERLFALTNADRAAAGLDPLHLDPALVGFARERSRDMAVRDYFAHAIPPSGQLVFAALMEPAGYCYAAAAENIGWVSGSDDLGAVEYVEERFMASPDHRPHILDARFRRVGIGVYLAESGRYLITVLFSAPCAPRARPSAAPRAARPTRPGGAGPSATPLAARSPDPELIAVRRWRAKAARLELLALSPPRSLVAI